MPTAIVYDININIAKACKKFQIRNFSFVSTAGANYKSDNFYLKLKGEIEKDIISMNLPSTSIYRPSLLLGERKERRIGEKLAQFLKIFKVYIILFQIFLCWLSTKYLIN